MPNNILPNKLVGYPKKNCIKPPNKLLRTDCHYVNGNFGFAKDLITYCLCNHVFHCTFVFHMPNSRDVCLFNNFVLYLLLLLSLIFPIYTVVFMLT